MADPFMGELRMVSFSYPPRGWAFCNGQLMPINQNQALFSLLGTQFGGNGQTTFALPDLRGRIPMHFGDSGHTIGEQMGEQAHTLTASEMPAHTHLVGATTQDATQSPPAGTALAKSPNMYVPFGSPTTIAPGTISNVGGSQPHENRQPYGVVNWTIALVGVFPSRN
jgi:microcystin-dependent protein